MGIMNLTDIKGIGKTYAIKLKRVGISNIQDLRKMNIEKVAKIAGLGKKSLKRWQDQACNTQIISDIKGIGPTYQKKMEKKDVSTLEELAQADSCIAGEIGVSEKRFINWVQQAQRIVKPPKPVAKKAVVAEDIGAHNAVMTILGKTSKVKIKEKVHEKVPVFRGAGMEDLAIKGPIAVHIDDTGTVRLWFNESWYENVPVSHESLLQRIKRIVLG